MNLNDLSTNQLVGLVLAAATVVTVWLMIVIALVIGQKRDL